MKRPVAIVLGGGGFLGRYVCREFALNKYAVYAVGHGTWSAEERAKWGIERWVAADISQSSISEAAGSDAPQAIVHCGGTGSVSSSYSAPFDDHVRTVQSTASVLEYARRVSKDPPRVVLTSSAAVYGDQGEVDAAETATRSPVSPYGFNKVASENLCDMYSRFFGVPNTVIRLFSVYGEGLRKQLLWDAMNKLVRNESTFFGTGHEVRDWIHVEDAARLLVLAATASPQGIFEIYNGAHEHASIREVLVKLFRLSGSAQVPQFNGKTHVGNPRRLTANCNHARRQLGWQAAISLDEGLERYVRWYQREPIR